MASPDSMRRAIFYAIDIFKNRKEYLQLSKDPLPMHTDQEPLDEEKDETLEH